MESLSNSTRSKSEPNVLKILLIVPSSTSQKVYPLFFYILISSPITPIVFCLLYCPGTDIQRNMDLMHMLL